MLWEVNVFDAGREPARDQARQDFDLLTHSRRGPDIVTGASRGYLIEGDLAHPKNQERLLGLLVDPVVERVVARPINDAYRAANWADTVTVLRKPGVMDPVAQTVQALAHDLGLRLDAVRTFRRYT